MLFHLKLESIEVKLPCPFVFYNNKDITSKHHHSFYPSDIIARAINIRVFTTIHFTMMLDMHFLKTKTVTNAHGAASSLSQISALMSLKCL
jgi:hypothetical protein